MTAVAVPPAVLATFLTRVRTRLAEAGALTKGEYARSRAGFACDPADPQAVCWCLVGGITVEAERSRDLGTPTAVREAAEAALTETLGLHAGVGLTLEGWNDRHAPDEVLRVLDLVIAGLTGPAGAAA